MNSYTYIALRNRLELLDSAADWFHEKGVFSKRGISVMGL